MDLSRLSSNWKNLQGTLRTDQTHSKNENLTRKSATKRKHEDHRNGLLIKSTNTRKPRKKHRQSSTGVNGSGHLGRDTVPELTQTNDSSEENDISGRAMSANRIVGEDVVNAGLSVDIEVGKYIAIDCEMVGIGPHPDLSSALARVSIVDWEGTQVYDSYVRPLGTVTDWRTAVSGIKSQHMEIARSFEEVQKDIAKLLKDRIVIGHSLRNDFDALLLSHPKRDIRDTARHPDYRKLAGGSAPRLQVLAQELLGLRIQTGEHSSLEDARACMLLFRRDKASFEREYAKIWPNKPNSGLTKIEQHGEITSQRRNKKKKKSKKKR